MDEKINAVKNSPASPTKKEKIRVNPCKSVSRIERGYTLYTKKEKP